MVSRIRCPVISGTLAGYLWLTGLGTRMGQCWVMESSRLVPSASSMVTMVSSMVYWPSATVSTTVPSTLGGTMHLCTMAEVSGTSAMMVPPRTRSPVFTVIWVSHSFLRSSASTLTPRVINAPPLSAIRSRGRSIPSKILFRIPGASVTEMAAPVASTVSPGRRPEVSS